MPSTQELLDRAVEKLKAANQAQFDELEPKIQDAIKAGRGVSELTEQFEKVNDEVAKTTEEIRKLSEQLTQEKEGLEARLDEFEKRYGHVSPGGSAVGVAYKSAGRLFTENDHVQQALERNKSTVQVDRLSKVSVPLESLGLTKDISTASGSAGALTDSLRLPGVVTQPNVSLPVQALLPRTSIDNARIDYARESGYTNNAAPVAETTSASSLVAKPKSAITFELITETMRTIAHWVPASKQILRFSNSTQLQNYINGRLTYGLELELEDQILLGDGTGQNLSGLVPNATAYNRGYAQIQSANPTKIDTLRRAMTQARLAEYPVTGMVLHPTDWEDITLTKGSDLHYIFASPGQMTTPRLWGVPVADTSRMNEGEFLVGAFALGAEIFFGLEATIEVGTQHGEFFTANMVAILAELMALLAIYRPEAFVTGPFQAGSGS